MPQKISICLSHFFKPKIQKASWDDFSVPPSMYDLSRSLAPIFVIPHTQGSVVAALNLMSHVLCASLSASF